jgi:hypothetical protein
MQHARWEGCSEPCLRNCHAHSTHHEHLNTDEEFVRISLARSWAPAALKGHVLNTSHNHPGQNQHAGCQKITKTFQQFASCCVLDRGTFTGLCERYTRSSKSINVMMRHASFSTEAHSHTKKQTSTNFSRTNSQRTKIQDHMPIIPFLPVASSDSSSRPACFSCSRSSKLPRFACLGKRIRQACCVQFWVPASDLSMSVFSVCSCLASPGSCSERRSSKLGRACSCAIKVSGEKAISQQLMMAAACGSQWSKGEPVSQLGRSWVLRREPFTLAA